MAASFIRKLQSASYNYGDGCESEKSQVYGETKLLGCIQPCSSHKHKHCMLLYKPLLYVYLVW
jgi:hypothetical protein